MNKSEFIESLRDKLSVLPQEDIQKSVDYYSEMIDDITEDGNSEEEAVKAVGTTDEIASQILMDTPLPKLVKAKVKPKRTLKGWEIILIILGFPLWMPLIIAAISVVFSIYVVIWSIIVSLYAVVFSMFISAGACIIAFFAAIYSGSTAKGMIILGVSLFCLGAAILLLLAFNQVAKGTLWLSKTIVKNIKSCFVKKGNNNENF